MEVITDNERAILAYQKVGFKIDRQYKLYKFNWIASAPEIQVKSEFEIQVIADFSFDDFEHLQNYFPSLENQNHCLEAYKNSLVSISVFDQTEMVAYLIVHKFSKRIHRLGVKENDWNTFGKILFSGLESGNYNIINIDSKNKNMHNFLKEMKFDNYTDQYDMSFNFDIKSDATL